MSYLCFMSQSKKASLLCLSPNPLTLTATHLRVPGVGYACIIGGGAPAGACGLLLLLALPMECVLGGVLLLLLLPWMGPPLLLLKAGRQQAESRHRTSNQTHLNTLQRSYLHCYE